MSYQQDENKAPHLNEVNNVAKQNIQAPLVRKEKNRNIKEHCKEGFEQ
ncbi:hypothetical protein T08_12715 [Trichinella sp. T8]|nr:hypothetical protein T08_12715 [Trichinella sp. T8]